MMKRTIVVLALLSLASVDAAFAQSGVVGKRRSRSAANAAAAPARAYGAPAVAHAQAAQHVAAPAEMRAQSRVLRETAPTAINGRNSERSNATPARVDGNDNRGIAAEANRPRVADQTGWAPQNRTRADARQNGLRSNARYRSFTEAQRSWHRQRHDRGWWRSHYTRIIVYGGGYYYWDAGWWYPAYGYDPLYSNYVYDGPIYGYNDLPPGDVVSETQQALAAQGYYSGPIDGIIGPMTRSAIQRYQIDHGLAATSVIDEQTLYSLGIA